MDQPVLADVKVPRARAASPVVRLAVGEVVLEVVHAGVALLSHLLHLEEDLALDSLKRLEGPHPVVNYPERAGKAELPCASAHYEGVFRALDSAADHRIDVYLELGQLAQPPELLIDHLEALLRHVVGRDVVHADLQVFQPHIVQLEYSLPREQIPICYQPGQHSALPDPGDRLFDPGMEKRLAAAERDGGRAELGQPVDAAEEVFEGDRGRVVVILVAVAAGEIASPDRDQVSEYRMIRRKEPTGEKGELSVIALELLCDLHVDFLR